MTPNLFIGDGDFVKKVLDAAEEKMKRRYAIQPRAVNLESLADRAAEIFDMPVGYPANIGGACALKVFYVIGQIGSWRSVCQRFLAE